MNERTVMAAVACLAASLAALLGGCGGGDEGGGVFAGLDREVRTFGAVDFGTGAYYQLQAYKGGEGAHCYVYVGLEEAVSQATVDAVIAEFDTNIYPQTTAAFGSEPTPGIDGDPKIYILLLDIRDTWSGPSDPYVAGYFDPANEYPQSAVAADNVFSNEKEMLYVDTRPGVAGSLGSLRTVAHEFQHMIHLRQKWQTYGVDDADWLDEAMSEIAPVYCNYGPAYERVYTFESEPWNSLTTWDNRVEDYGVAYMWAQYVKDRVDPSAGNTVFWRMIHRSEAGIASVDAALGDIAYGKSFGGVFRDWAVANYSGYAHSWPGHPEWSYATVNTWPGIYPVGEGSAVELPGLFGNPARTDCTALSPLGTWSVGYYSYTAPSGSAGSVTWTAAPSSSEWASLADNVVLNYGLVSGNPYSYAGEGYLVVANPASSASNGLIITTGSPGPLFPASARASAPATVSAMLAEARRSTAVQRLAVMTGRPVSVCVHPLLKAKARPLLQRGVRPGR